ncbi:MAG TPA: hypothetical protein VJ251_23830 [Stellaceae bacterium]|nr:hypothetical protein [Stellaceae bacterium]
MVLHRHHHRAHHSVGYIGRSGDEQKIASRHPRSRHGILASETTVAESPSFYTDCGNIKRFPRRSPQGSGVVNACTFLGGSGGVAGGAIAFARGFVSVLMMIALAGIIGAALSRGISETA